MKEKLDRIFSLYVRRRDCPGGVGHCISCGCSVTLKTCDCGHYIPRAHTATRWNEYNCSIQCKFCNQYKHGNLESYRLALIRRYGLAVVEELERLKHTEIHLSDNDYLELIKYFKRKIAELR